MIQERPSSKEARKRIHKYYERGHHEQLQRIGLRIYLKGPLVLSALVATVLCIGLLLFTAYPILAIILGSATIGCIMAVVQTSIVPMDFSYSKNQILLKMVQYISQHRLSTKQRASIKQCAADGVAAGGIRTAMPMLIIPIGAAYWLGTGTMSPTISFIVGAMGLATVFLFIHNLCEINSNSMIGQAIGHYDQQQADLMSLLEKDVPERNQAFTVSPTDPHAA
jgi:hypothetical protein